MRGRAIHLLRTRAGREGTLPEGGKSDGEGSRKAKEGRRSDSGLHTNCKWSRRKKV